MTKLRQSFQNKTVSAQFINLELSTARFRLDPEQELILIYDSEEVQDNLGAALRIEWIANGESIELVVWTGEDEMFYPDGRSAPRNFDPL